MKKKLVSTLALSLCFVMSAGAFAGCKDPEDKPLTQDEIYAKVVEAAKATAAYTGAFTLTETSANTEKSVRPDEDGEEVYTENSTNTLTADPAAKRFVMTQSATETDGTETNTSTMKSKLFKEGEKYYNYASSAYSANPNNDYEQYAEVSAFMAGVALNQYSLKNFNFGEGMLPMSVTSLADYNAAWASYIADSKAEIVAGSTDEDSDWYEFSAPEASYTVSAAEVDGAYTLSVKMSYSLTDYDDETYEASFEYVYTAKDGKIVSVLEKEEYRDTWYEADDGEGNWDYVPKGTAGAQVALEEEKEETLTTISYAFDQANYDAIATTVPADVQVQSDMIAKKMDVVVNGVKNEDEYIYGRSVEEALAEAWSNSNADVVWYKDEACTQVIDASAITLEQLYALDTLYAKVTAKAGYVLYTNESSSAFATDVPDAYKNALVGYLDSHKEVSVCSVAEGIYLWTNDDRKEIFVNGTKVERGTDAYMLYAVVEGQTYEVKEVYTVNKAALNFFYVMGD